MPARAHFVTYLLDTEGRPIPGATVAVREPDTETLISETIYAADDPDGTTKTNPFTAAADGKCEIWLTVPKVVDLFVTKTGYPDSTFRAAAHSLTAGTLTLIDDGTPLAQRAGVNFQDGFVLADDAGNNETEIDLDYAGTAQIADVTKAAEAAGTSTKVARGDHKHDVTTAAAGTSAPGASAAEGSATSLARSDHAHGREAYATTAQIADVTKAAESAGTDPSVARGDHKHDVSTATAGASAPADTAIEGTATSLARSDHRHSRESYATVTELADVSHASEAAGSSNTIARGDHKHDVSLAGTAQLANIAASEAEGSSDTIPRGDHVHAHGSGYAGGHTDSGIPTTWRAFARKAGQQNVASTTLTNDDDLFFAVGANEVWEFEIVAKVAASADTTDFKWDITMPASGAFTGNVSRIAVGSTSLAADYHVSVLDQTDFPHSQGALSAIWVPVVIRGVYVGAGSAGTVQFRFAANAAGNVTAGINSFLIANRVV